MQTWRESQQKLYILNRRPYRETSLLIEALTQHHGRVGFIAKGARGPKSPKAGLLQPFLPLNCNWQGRGDLATLTQIERDEMVVPALQGRSLYCGFYLNELLTLLLHRHDPHPKLFEKYEQTLLLLTTADKDVDWPLRQFELTLLSEIGYGLNAAEAEFGGAEVDPNESYAYLPETGLVRVTSGASPEGVIQGQTLLNLFHDQPGTATQRYEAKRFMRGLIDHHLNGKLLKSRELFGEFTQQTS